jgi:hypothetical protein
VFPPLTRFFSRVYKPQLTRCRTRSDTTRAHPCGIVDRSTRATALVPSSALLGQLNVARYPLHDVTLQLVGIAPRDAPCTDRPDPVGQVYVQSGPAATVSVQVP